MNSFNVYTRTKTVHVFYECVQVSEIEICLTNNLFFCFYFCYAINVLQLEIVVVDVVCGISIFNLGFYIQFLMALGAEIILIIFAFLGLKTQTKQLSVSLLNDSYGCDNRRWRLNDLSDLFKNRTETKKKNFFLIFF